LSASKTSGRYGSPSRVWPSAGLSGRTEPGGADCDLDRMRAQPFAQRARAGGVGDGDQRGPEAPHLLRQLLDVAPRRERRDREPLGKRFGDRQRLLADAARAAEDREAPHASARRPPRVSFPHARLLAPAGS